MNVNTVLTLVSIVAFIIALVVPYVLSARKTDIKEVKSYKTMERLIEAVKNYIIDVVSEDYTLGLSEVEFKRLYKRKARINEALNKCVHGVPEAKSIVIDLIRLFIVENVMVEEVSELLGITEDLEPSIMTKFEIIMYKYKQIHDKKAFMEWVNKPENDFIRERQALGKGRRKCDKAYYITVQDVENSYKAENYTLTDDEKIDVLAVLVYQQYKGFGLIDTLREMDIDGFNMGTSGAVQSVHKQKRIEDKATNSVWAYVRGRYIHLQFLNFGSDDELRRIIQLLVRWGNPGPLTAKRGYLVNTMEDKSRILALRPPASEYWAVFVRKFTLSDVSPEKLIIKEYTKNGHLPLMLLEYITRAGITSGVTGRQGSGKTTLLSSLIRYIDARYTIRVIEMAPELYLRELYPNINILSVQETTTTSAEELQDALKKSDGTVSIVGEVATASIAARMIQIGQVASKFTFFTHHANTPKDLVYALRNALVETSGFSNMQTAEKQVIDVVKLDIHLEYTPNGHRYIERISEIVPMEEGIPYPEINLEDPAMMLKLFREYFTRSTDRVSFYTHNILEYDLVTSTYNVADRFSDVLEKRILTNLGDLAPSYELFMLKYWGAKPGTEEYNMSKEELEERIAYLESHIDKESLLANFKQMEVAKIEDEQPEIVEEEVASNEDSLWKSWKDGYNPNSTTPYKSAEDFSLGDFFDDSEYED